MTGLLDALRGEDQTFTVCCMTQAEHPPVQVSGVTYYFVPYRAPSLTERFRALLQEVQPDLVEIFGTEFAHSHAMLQAAGPKKTAISLQGLVSVLAQSYYNGLPAQTVWKSQCLCALNRLRFRPSMPHEQAFYRKNGVLEVQTLRSAAYVIGRTAWDHAHALLHNPQVQYFACNEILRSVFYQAKKWELARCEPHSIFVSQASYPIKGFHQLLKALPLLLSRYPDLRVFVGGAVQKNEYMAYLQKEIRTHHWETHIVWLGQLSEAQMVERYQKSHVFVCCSSMENESNALSEAKLLGVPCVASYVGGMRERIRDGEDGFLYPYAEPELLAFSVGRIFDDAALAGRFSQNAVRSAAAVNDPAANAARRLEIYAQIAAQTCPKP